MNRRPPHASQLASPLARWCRRILRRARRYSLRRHLANLPIPKKLALIIVTFLLIIATLLLASQLGMGVLSDVRAYVGGEGLWSKSQKDAVYRLMRYAIFRDEADYDQYLAHLSVPLGDRQARLAMSRGGAEYRAAAEDGLLQGRNHPKDVRGMTLLFRRFGFVSYIRKATDIWERADRQLDDLISIGEEVREYVRTGEPDMRQVKQFLQRIERINAKLTTLEDEFSYTLGESARWMKEVLWWFMLAVTGLLLMVGLLIATHIARYLVAEIYRLRQRAMAVAKGQYTEALEPESQDEIGDLARNFQQMVAQRERAEQALAQRARELNDANAKLIETERIKDTFVATISHELRTPLTLILAPLESLLAERASQPADRQRLLLQTVHNNAIRLLQLVTGLLDFSRLEAGRTEVRREAIALVATTRAVLFDFKPLMLQKGIEGRFEAEPSEAIALIDRYLYERIVFNLLSNAVKFTPRGGSITVRLAWTNHRLTLVVQDTGIGIAAQDLGQLFQKFRQLEGASTRRFDGTGLGLALVKEFAQLLGGSVAVESREGEGSAFTVDCSAPRADAPSGALPAVRLGAHPTQRFGDARLPRTPRDGAAQRDLPRLLIAEDNAELADYASDLLREYCRVMVVRDGEAALQAVQDWAPDLVLLDVMMPKQDGMSVCRAMKANVRTSGIPVILLTALTNRVAMLQGWEAGADEYLFKPFHPAELVTRVKAILASLEQRRLAEAAIREAHARLAELAAIVESSEDAICSAALDGTLLTWNRSAQRLFGFSADMIIGQPLSRLVPPSHREELTRVVARTQQGEQVEHCETVCARDDGRAFDASVTVSPVKNADGRIAGISLIVRDITERKVLERNLVTVSEREKERIGRDLHDSLCQELTGLAFMSEALERRLVDVSPDDAARASRMTALINKAIEQTRDLVEGLVPLELRRGGLAQALQVLACTVEELTGIACRFTGEPCELPDQDTATHLYRIAQEALHNAISHGRAAQVTISLATQECGILLTIADDGVGMPVAPAGEPGLGLRSMRYRAAMIGATFHISPNATGGTLVTCTLPHRARQPSYAAS